MHTFTESRFDEEAKTSESDQIEVSNMQKGTMDLKLWQQNKIKKLKGMKKRNEDENEEADLLTMLCVFHVMIEVVICVVTVCYFIALAIYIVFMCMGDTCCMLCSDD